MKAQWAYFWMHLKAAEPAVHLHMWKVWSEHPHFKTNRIDRKIVLLQQSDSQLQYSLMPSF